MSKENIETRATIYPVWCVIVLCAVPEICLSSADWGLIDLQRLRAYAYENAGFWPGLLGSWQPNYAGQSWLMFLSYGFLHGGLIHLLVNMATLWSLGKNVLNRVGAIGFLVLYLGSQVGGAIGFALLANTLQPMVGASGALFGLAGGILAWNYVDRFTFDEGLWPVAQAALLLGALNVVLWIVMDGHLAWQTHLGGFLSGWVLALLINPKAHQLEG